MSEIYKPPEYVTFKGSTIDVATVFALYDAGDVCEIIMKPGIPEVAMGASHRTARVHRVDLSVAEVTSMIGRIVPVIHGHLARRGP